MTLKPRVPHSHVLMTGGGVRVIFFGSEILTKGDFFGSMKDAGIFWVPKKNGGFLRVAKKELRVFGGGYAKKSSDFFWVDKF